MNEAQVKFIERARLNPTISEAFLIAAFVSTNIDFTHQFILTQGKKYWYPDFLVKGKKLIIEVDGNEHFQEKRLSKDTVRDAAAIEMGYSVARFTNKQAQEIPHKIVDFINSHTFEKPMFYDMRVAPVLKSSIQDIISWNAIPMTCCKDGETRHFKSISQALKYYKIGQSEWLMLVKNNPNESTYTSKTGITLTKTELK
jgi:very-short-patch-repair endonuclease